MHRGYVLASLVGAVLLASGAGCHRSPAPAARSVGEAGITEGTPTTADNCRACDGDFGPHGLDPAPRCNCRTHDAGKRCRGKEDCEAECVSDGGEREITDPGPPPRGFWVGRCAELRTTYGCHVFLPRREPGAAPAALEPPPTKLCVD
jgi:hypothetical protein